MLITIIFNETILLIYTIIEKYSEKRVDSKEIC